MIRLRFLGLVLLATVVGCSGGDQEAVRAPELTPRNAIKKSLNQMLESGAPGSEIGGLMEGIEALKQNDPALASTLEADVDELMRVMSLDDPTGMQVQVEEMLMKLEGGGGT